jgi:hypothetical protein
MFVSTLEPAFRISKGALRFLAFVKCDEYVTTGTGIIGPGAL